MARTRRWRPDGNAAPCGQATAGGAALFRHQAAIVNAPGRVKDFEPPSSAVRSQTPGVAVLTSIVQLRLVAVLETMVPGNSTFALEILTRLMTSRLAPVSWSVIEDPLASAYDFGSIPVTVGAFAESAVAFPTASPAFLADVAVPAPR